MQRTTLISLFPLWAALVAGCQGEDRGEKQAASQDKPKKTISALALSEGEAVDAMTVRLVCADYGDSDAESLPFEVKAGEPIHIFGEPKDCTLRLLAFKMGGKAFAPAADDDFSTYYPGDVATFTDGASKLALRVDTQLASPLESDSVVKYVYSQLVRDEDVTLEGLDVTVTDHTVVVEGEPAPAVKLVKAQLIGKSAKAGKVKLTMVCDGESCDADLKGGLDMHLGLAPAGELDLAAFDVLFKAKKQTIKSLEVTVSLAALGCKSIDELRGKRLVFALRRVGGVSVRYAYINVPEGELPPPPPPAGKSCEYAKGIVIASGDVFVDKSKPRFAEPTAKECKVVAYETYACVDGKLFAQNLEGTYSSCKPCDENVAQTKL